MVSSPISSSINTTQAFAQRRTHGDKPTVMLVDDDAFMHDLLDAVLGGPDPCPLYRAHNGLEAMRLLRTLAPPPDLILCDIFMPDMDGIEFLGHLASLRYAGDIVLMSGVDNTMLSVARDIARHSGLHLAGVFEKPLPLAELQRLLQHYPQAIPEQSVMDSSALGASASGTTQQSQ